MKESGLYEALRQTIKGYFDNYYVSEPYVYQNGHQAALSNGITNPQLWITANGEFPETLQTNFDYYLFKKLYAEKLHPDIMGFVDKKQKDPTTRAFITIEVKKGPLRIRDVLQAKLYETIFNAKFSFLISPQGITIEKLKVLLQHEELRGQVMIGQCSKDGSVFRLYPELVKLVPKEFQRLCRDSALLDYKNNGGFRL